MSEPTVDDLRPHPRILALEDDQDIGLGLQTALSDEGYAVDVFPDIEQVQSLDPETLGRYSVIIADPHVSGGAEGAVAMARLRQKLNLRAGLLVLSASTINQFAPPVQKIVKESEPTEYMTKPYDLDELTAAVGRLATATVKAQSKDASSGSNA